MNPQHFFHRRGFLKSLLPLAAVTPVLAQSASNRKGREAALPARPEILIRGGYVITMDPGLGDIANADVHIRNGEIAAVGPDLLKKGLKIPRANLIDGRGMIVLPGLVETHWHMWNTGLRSFAGDKPAEGYFPTAAALGSVMTAEDMYCGTRLAAASALNAGMTTVHDFCHNLRSRAHAEADLRALRETGVRARWSYGWAQGLANDKLCNLGDLKSLHGDWKSISNDGLISLGFASRSMFRNGPLPTEVYRAEIETARSLDIPISAHIGSSDSAKGEIEAHARANLLGKDVQIIHGLAASPGEIEMVAKAGSSLSVSPGTELRIGYGFTRVMDYLDAGVPVGVSVDTAALSGETSLFGVLKLLRNVENARAHSEFKMPARLALELGTIRGAQSLGIADRVGSLKPGKRADVILVTTNQLNMAAFTDPIHMLVECAEPENIDTVICDGRILKRSGKLTALSAERVASEAAASFAALRSRARWRE